VLPVQWVPPAAVAPFVAALAAEGGGGTIIGAVVAGADIVLA
jgi:hypothetical protein